jgi:hypothetical protein
MHFLGVGWSEVQRMPYSDFVVLFKCASMLSAREKLATINLTNFAHIKEDERVKILRELKSGAVEFIEQRVKDYREVLGNLAKRVLNGGR